MEWEKTTSKRTSATHSSVHGRELQLQRIATPTLSHGLSCDSRIVHTVRLLPDILSLRMATKYAVSHGLRLLLSLTR